MRTVLVDVDTQVDFCDPRGALFVKGADRLHDVFAGLVTRAAGAGFPIVSSVDSHAFDAWEFAGAPEPGPAGEHPEFPPHCVKGTSGWLKLPGTLAPRARFVPNVALAPADLDAFARRHDPQQLVLEKEVYSLFANPNADGLLDRVLEGADGGRFFVFGVALDYCVRAAALGLVDYVKRRGGRGEVHLLADATASVDPAGGTRALEECRAAGVRETPTADLLASM